METYVFFRDGGWYTVRCKDDEAAKVQAEINPGTKRVEHIYGRVVWRLQ